MSEQKTIITVDLNKAVTSLLKGYAPDSIFIVTDETVAKYCLPTLLEIPNFKDAHVLTLPVGEQYKNIDTMVSIWHFLVEKGATRHSLLVNLGGGVVSDLGGFAASTFKRGMNYLNLPTTILAAVDAATGGKSGFNFEGLKNEIGLYNPSLFVVVYMDFFKTLDQQNILSGFAEMIKHALIADAILLDQSLEFDIDHIDWRRFQYILEQNLSIKQRIVDKDPHEKGPRKALNFGHTFGHAFETLSYRTEHPMLHGYAVMWGCVCALYLSHILLKFPKERLLQLLYFAKENYGAFPFTCQDYDELLELMKHDKKNEQNIINFSLLSDIGDVRVNQHATKEQILEALDFVREN